LIKGPSGTNVSLTMKRGNDEFQVTIEREKIALHSVYTEIKDNKTMGIRI